LDSRYFLINQTWDRKAKSNDLYSQWGLTLVTEMTEKGFMLSQAETLTIETPITGVVNRTRRTLYINLTKSTFNDKPVFEIFEDDEPHSLSESVNNVESD
jgi:hypothetical protein